MVYKENFKFKINSASKDNGTSTEESIYQANRHKGVYDIYVVNGQEYQRERVAAFIEKGKWIVL